MAKVLITGATGFIGNHVTRLCLEKGDTVRVMVMPGEDRSPLQGMDVEFVEGVRLRLGTGGPPDATQCGLCGAATLHHCFEFALKAVCCGRAIHFVWHMHGCFK